MEPRFSVSAIIDDLDSIIYCVMISILSTSDRQLMREVSSSSQVVVVLVVVAVVVVVVVVVVVAVARL